jgi:putative transcriptional regulator
MRKQYRSKALAAVHETAAGLHNAGVMDETTMKAFDAICVSSVKSLPTEKVRRTRDREH